MLVMFSQEFPWNQRSTFQCFCQCQLSGWVMVTVWPTCFLWYLRRFYSWWFSSGTLHIIDHFPLCFHNLLCHNTRDSLSHRMLQQKFFYVGPHWLWRASAKILAVFLGHGHLLFKFLFWKTQLLNIQKKKSDNTL